MTSLTLSKERRIWLRSELLKSECQIRSRYCCATIGSTKKREVVVNDKFVSTEMLEAVEREYLNTYFKCVDTLLK